jgi:hypothetical protein
MCLLNVEHCLETSSNWVTNEAIVFVVSNKPVAAAKYDDHSRDNRKSKRLEAKLDCFSWTQSCFPTPQQVSHFNKCWRVIHSFGFCLNYGDLYQVFIIMCLLITLINQRDFTHEREETLSSLLQQYVMGIGLYSCQFTAATRRWSGNWPRNDVDVCFYSTYLPNLMHFCAPTLILRKGKMSLFHSFSQLDWWMPHCMVFTLNVLLHPSRPRLVPFLRF